MRREEELYLQSGFRGFRPIKRANEDLAKKLNLAGMGYFDDQTDLSHLALVARNPDIEIFDFQGNFDITDLINWSIFVKRLATEDLQSCYAMNASLSQLIQISHRKERKYFDEVNTLGSLRDSSIESLTTSGLPIKIARFFKHATKRTMILPHS